MTGMTMVVMTIQKIIYMEAVPFEFYLEEKNDVDWIYQPFKNCKVN